MAKLSSRPMVYSKRDRHWRPLTWKQVGTRVRDTARGLCALDLSPGERVAILSASSVEWVIADLGALSMGTVDVAISETACESDIIYILKNSGSRAAFVGDQRLLDMVIRSHTELDDLALVILMHGTNVPASVPPDLRIMTQLQLEKLGREHTDEAVIDERINAIEPGDLMTLIYTSGTTGQPRGVMITHQNMLSNCDACSRAIPIHTDDILLSFLPLSHSFERMAGYYLPVLFGGATIYYARGIDTLMRDLSDVRPTLMTGVPRVFETLYSRIRLEAFQHDPVRRYLFNHAVAVGRRMSQQRAPSRFAGQVLGWQYRLIRNRLFASIRAAFGGRIRLFVSGGAPLSKDIASFFFATGILVLEGYGLTEASPVVSVNRADAFRFGTVGRPLDNVRVRLAADGEILVKGPNVMEGYWLDERATEEAVEDSGWLSTGDIGVLERDGFLRITDRKKDLFKDTGGRYIAPQKLEGTMREDPFIDQAVVLGDGRPCCVALITPNLGALERWCERQGLQFENSDDLFSQAEVDALFSKRIKRVNARLARHEAIRAFHVVSTPFSTENTQLTPSLKVRRAAVSKAYSAEIEAMYVSLDN
ncbi:MAG: long-chain fatty acid--CoA ligase [Myxococcota bacterium]|nr:long-chain fatty acid--CoA ligase [Myxococcota bacterium]